MDVQALVFDFGNVVGLFDHRLTTNRLAQHTEITADDLHARLFGSALEDEYESGKLSTADFLREVRANCRLTCSEKVVAEAWADIFRPNPEICALLPRLKPHYRLLLGSNTNELHSQHFSCQFADTLRYFDAIVLSHQIGVRKPKAGFFEHCQKLAACPPEQCLFIDDLPANVAGAIECGWQAILYTGTADLLKRFAALGIKLVGAEENEPCR